MTSAVSISLLFELRRSLSHVVSSDQIHTQANRSAPARTVKTRLRVSALMLLALMILLTTVLKHSRFSVVAVKNSIIIRVHDALWRAAADFARIGSSRFAISEDLGRV
jgi:hypothetical protein